MENLYQKKLMDRYRKPRHKGALSGTHVHVSQQANPACGDQVTVFLQIDGDTIAHAQFTGVGCILSLATADLLMEAVTGLKLQQVDELTVQTVQELTGMQVGPTRQQCIALSLETLKQARAHARSA